LNIIGLWIEYNRVSEKINGRLNGEDKSLVWIEDKSLGKFYDTPKNLSVLVHQIFKIIVK